MSLLARFKIITKILAVIMLLSTTAIAISWLGIHAMASLNTGADNMSAAAQRALEAARANQSVIALNRADEFKLHVRAALESGTDVALIKEVILQSAIYCGVPAANSAFHQASQIIAELDLRV